MAVEGDLKDVSLPGLVQMICLEQRRTALVLRRQREEGVIFFDGGEIVHAIAASLVGEEALYHLLSWTDGTFRMGDHVTVPRRTVTGSWSHLLMEAMRRLDEKKAREMERAQEERALSPAEVEQDSTLENELILLLSTLEHARARLAGRKNQKRPSLALQILAEMVNDVVAFSEERVDARTRAESLAKVLTRASVVHPAVRLLPTQHNRLPVQMASKLYGHWAGDAAGRRQTFRQIVGGMLDVLEAYLSFFTSRFRSASVADQWRETYGIFLTDLTRTVDEIRL